MIGRDESVTCQGVPLSAFLRWQAQHILSKKNLNATILENEQQQYYCYHNLCTFVSK